MVSLIYLASLKNTFPIMKDESSTVHRYSVSDITDGRPSLFQSLLIACALTIDTMRRVLAL